MAEKHIYERPITNKDKGVSADYTILGSDYFDISFYFGNTAVITMYDGKTLYDYGSIKLDGGINNTLGVLFVDSGPLIAGTQSIYVDTTVLKTAVKGEEDFKGKDLTIAIASDNDLTIYSSIEMEGEVEGMSGKKGIVVVQDVQTFKGVDLSSFSGTYSTAAGIKAKNLTITGGVTGNIQVEQGILSCYDDELLDFDSLTGGTYSDKIFEGAAIYAAGTLAIAGGFSSKNGNLIRVISEDKENTDAVISGTTSLDKKYGLSTSLNLHSSRHSLTVKDNQYLVSGFRGRGITIGGDVDGGSIHTTLNRTIGAVLIHNREFLVPLQDSYYGWSDSNASFAFDGGTMGYTFLVGRTYIVFYNDNAHRYLLATVNSNLFRNAGYDAADSSSADLTFKGVFSGTVTADGVAKAVAKSQLENVDGYRDEGAVTVIDNICYRGRWIGGTFYAQPVMTAEVCSNELLTYGMVAGDQLVFGNTFSNGVINVQSGSYTEMGKSVDRDRTSAIAWAGVTEDGRAVWNNDLGYELDVDAGTVRNTGLFPSSIAIATDDWDARDNHYGVEVSAKVEDNRFRTEGLSGDIVNNAVFRGGTIRAGNYMLLDARASGYSCYYSGSYIADTSVVSIKNNSAVTAAVTGGTLQLQDFDTTLNVNSDLQVILSHDMPGTQPNWSSTAVVHSYFKNNVFTTAGILAAEDEVLHSGTVPDNDNISSGDLATAWIKLMSGTTSTTYYYAGYHYGEEDSQNKYRYVWVSKDGKETAYTECAVMKAGDTAKVVRSDAGTITISTETITAVDDSKLSIVNFGSTVQVNSVVDVRMRRQLINENFDEGDEEDPPLDVAGNYFNTYGLGGPVVTVSHFLDSTNVQVNGAVSFSKVGAGSLNTQDQVNFIRVAGVYAEDKLSVEQTLSGTFSVNQITNDLTEDGIHSEYLVAGLYGREIEIGSTDGAVIQVASGTTKIDNRIVAGIYSETTLSAGKNAEDEVQSFRIDNGTLIVSVGTPGEAETGNRFYHYYTAAAVYAGNGMNLEVNSAVYAGVGNVATITVGTGVNAIDYYRDSDKDYTRDNDSYYAWTYGDSTIYTTTSRPGAGSEYDGTPYNGVSAGSPITKVKQATITIGGGTYTRYSNSDKGSATYKYAWKTDSGDDTIYTSADSSSTEQKDYCHYYEISSTSTVFITVVKDKTSNTYAKTGEVETVTEDKVTVTYYKWQVFNTVDKEFGEEDYIYTTTASPSEDDSWYTQASKSSEGGNISDPKTGFYYDGYEYAYDEEDETGGDETYKYKWYRLFNSKEILYTASKSPTEGTCRGTKTTVTDEEAKTITQSVITVNDKEYVRATLKDGTCKDTAFQYAWVEGGTEYIYTESSEQSATDAYCCDIDGNIFPSKVSSASDQTITVGNKIYIRDVDRDGEGTGKYQFAWKNGEEVIYTTADPESGYDNELGDKNVLLQTKIEEVLEAGIVVGGGTYTRSESDDLKSGALAWKNQDSVIIYTENPPAKDGDVYGHIQSVFSESILIVGGTTYTRSIADDLTKTTEVFKGYKYAWKDDSGKIVYTEANPQDGDEDGVHVDPEDAITGGSVTYFERQTITVADKKYTRSFEDDKTKYAWTWTSDSGTFYYYTESETPGADESIYTYANDSAKIISAFDYEKTITVDDVEYTRYAEGDFAGSMPYKYAWRAKGGEVLYTNANEQDLKYDESKGNYGTAYSDAKKDGSKVAKFQRETITVNGGTEYSTEYIRAQEYDLTNAELNYDYQVAWQEKGGTEVVYTKSGTYTDSEITKFESGTTSTYTYTAAIEDVQAASGDVNDVTAALQRYVNYKNERYSVSGGTCYEDRKALLAHSQKSTGTYLSSYAISAQSTDMGINNNSTDNITIDSDAVIFGSIELGGGRNFVTIDSSAQLFGGIFSRYGDVNTLQFALRTNENNGNAPSELAVITATKSGNGALEGERLNYNINLQKDIKSGTYILIEGSDLHESTDSVNGIVGWVGREIGVFYGDGQTLTLTVNGGYEQLSDGRYIAATYVTTDSLLEDGVDTQKICITVSNELVGFAGTVSFSSGTLRWASQNNANGYVIQYKKKDSEGVSEWHTITTHDGTSYDFTGMLDAAGVNGTAYNFRVSAVFDDGSVSDWGVTAGTATSGNYAPSVSSDVVKYTPTGDDITLDWTDASSQYGIEKYTITVNSEKSDLQIVRTITDHEQVQTGAILKENTVVSDQYPSISVSETGGTTCTLNLSGSDHAGTVEIMGTISGNDVVEGAFFSNGIYYENVTVTHKDTAYTVEINENTRITVYDSVNGREPDTVAEKSKVVSDALIDASFTVTGGTFAEGEEPDTKEQQYLFVVEDSLGGGTVRTEGAGTKVTTNSGDVTFAGTFFKEDLAVEGGGTTGYTDLLINGKIISGGTLYHDVDVKNNGDDTWNKSSMTLKKVTVILGATVTSADGTVEKNQDLILRDCENDSVYMALSASETLNEDELEDCNFVFDDSGKFAVLASEGFQFTQTCTTQGSAYVYSAGFTEKDIENAYKDKTGVDFQGSTTIIGDMTIEGTRANKSKKYDVDLSTASSGTTSVGSLTIKKVQIYTNCDVTWKGSRYENVTVVTGDDTSRVSLLNGTTSDPLKTAFVNAEKTDFSYRLDNSVSIVSAVQSDSKTITVDSKIYIASGTVGSAARWIGEAGTVYTDSDTPSVSDAVYRNVVEEIIDGGTTSIIGGGTYTRKSDLDMAVGDYKYAWVGTSTVYTASETVGAGVIQSEGLQTIKMTENGVEFTGIINSRDVVSVTGGVRKVNDRAFKVAGGTVTGGILVYGGTVTGVSNTSVSEDTQYKNTDLTITGAYVILGGTFTSVTSGTTSDINILLGTEDETSITASYDLRAETVAGVVDATDNGFDNRVGFLLTDSNYIYINSGTHTVRVEVKKSDVLTGGIKGEINIDKKIFSNGGTVTGGTFYKNARIENDGVIVTGVTVLENATVSYGDGRASVYGGTVVFYDSGTFGSVEEVKSAKIKESTEDSENYFQLKFASQTASVAFTSLKTSGEDTLRTELEISGGAVKDAITGGTGTTVYDPFILSGNTISGGILYENVNIKAGSVTLSGVYVLEYGSESYTVIGNNASVTISTQLNLMELSGGSTALILNGGTCSTFTLSTSHLNSDVTYSFQTDTVTMQGGTSVDGTVRYRDMEITGGSRSAGSVEVDENTVSGEFYYGGTVTVSGETVTGGTVFVYGGSAAVTAKTDSLAGGQYCFTIDAGTKSTDESGNCIISKGGSVSLQTWLENKPSLAGLSSTPITGGTVTVGGTTFTGGSVTVGGNTITGGTLYSDVTFANHAVTIKNAYVVVGGELNGRRQTEENSYWIVFDDSFNPSEELILDVNVKLDNTALEGGKDRIDFIDGKAAIEVDKIIEGQRMQFSSEVSLEDVVGNESVITKPITIHILESGTVSEKTVESGTVFTGASVENGVLKLAGVTVYKNCHFSDDETVDTQNFILADDLESQVSVISASVGRVNEITAGTVYTIEASIVAGNKNKTTFDLTKVISGTLSSNQICTADGKTIVEKGDYSNVTITEGNTVLSGGTVTVSRVEGGTIYIESLTAGADTQLTVKGADRGSVENGVGQVNEITAGTVYTIEASIVAGNKNKTTFDLTKVISGTLSSNQICTADGKTIVEKGDYSNVTITEGNTVLSGGTVTVSVEGGTIYIEHLTAGADTQLTVKGADLGSVETGVEYVFLVDSEEGTELGFGWSNAGRDIWEGRTVTQTDLNDSLEKWTGGTATPLTKSTLPNGWTLTGGILHSGGTIYSGSGTISNVSVVSGARITDTDGKILSESGSVILGNEATVLTADQDKEGDLGASESEDFVKFLDATGNIIRFTAGGTVYSGTFTNTGYKGGGTGTDMSGSSILYNGKTLTGGKLYSGGSFETTSVSSDFGTLENTVMKLTNVSLLTECTVGDEGIKTILLGNEALTEISVVTDNEYGWSVAAGTFNSGSLESETGAILIGEEIREVADPENLQFSFDKGLTTLSWTCDTLADGYVLQYSTSEDFSRDVTTQSGITSTKFQLRILTSMEHYYWRIKAVKGSSQSNWVNGDDFKAYPYDVAEPQYSSGQDWSSSYTKKNEDNSFQLSLGWGRVTEDTGTEHSGSTYTSGLKNYVIRYTLNGKISGSQAVPISKWISGGGTAYEYVSGKDNWYQWSSGGTDPVYVYTKEADPKEGTQLYNADGGTNSTVTNGTVTNGTVSESWENNLPGYDFEFLRPGTYTDLSLGISDWAGNTLQEITSYEAVTSYTEITCKAGTSYTSYKRDASKDTVSGGTAYYAWTVGGTSAWYTDSSTPGKGANVYDVEAGTVCGTVTSAISNTIARDVSKDNSSKGYAWSYSVTSGTVTTTTTIYTKAYAPVVDEEVKVEGSTSTLMINGITKYHYTRNASKDEDDWYAWSRTDNQGNTITRYTKSVIPKDEEMFYVSTEGEELSNVGSVFNELLFEGGNLIIRDNVENLTVNRIDASGSNEEAKLRNQTYTVTWNGAKDNWSSLIGNTFDFEYELEYSTSAEFDVESTNSVTVKASEDGKYKYTFTGSDTGGVQSDGTHALAFGKKYYFRVTGKGSDSAEEAYSYTGESVISDPFTAADPYPFDSIDFSIKQSKGGINIAFGKTEKTKGNADTKAGRYAVSVYDRNGKEIFAQYTSETSLFIGATEAGLTDGEDYTVSVTPVTEYNIAGGCSSKAFIRNDYTAPTGTVDGGTSATPHPGTITVSYGGSTSTYTRYGEADKEALYAWTSGGTVSGGTVYTEKFVPKAGDGVYVQDSNKNGTVISVDASPTDTLELRWNEFKDASGIKEYVVSLTPAGGTAIDAGTITGGSYTSSYSYSISVPLPTENTQYTWSVKAYDNAGNWKEVSKTVTSGYWNQQAAPSNLVTGGTSVSWEVSTAGDLNFKVFVVSVKDDKDSEYTKTFDYVEGSGTLFVSKDGDRVTFAGGSYTCQPTGGRWTSVSDGSVVDLMGEYSWRVQAINSYENEGDSARELRVSTSDYSDWGETITIRDLQAPVINPVNVVNWTVTKVNALDTKNPVTTVTVTDAMIPGGTIAGGTVLGAYGVTAKIKGGTVVEVSGGTKQTGVSQADVTGVTLVGGNLNSGTVSTVNSEVREYTDGVTISWKPYEDMSAVEYNLIVWSTGGTIYNGKQTSTRKTTDWVTVSIGSGTLTENTTYYWKVSANDTSESKIAAEVQTGTFYSGYWKQQTGPNDLTAIVNQITNKVTLSWTAPEWTVGTEFDHYVVTVCNLNDKKESYTYNVKDTTLTISNTFFDRASYTWTVSAVNTLKDDIIVLDGGTVTYAADGIAASEAVSGVTFQTYAINGPDLSAVNVVNWTVTSVNGGTSYTGNIENVKIPGGTSEVKTPGGETVTVVTSARHAEAVINGGTVTVVDGGTVYPSAVFDVDVTGVTLVGGTLTSGTIVNSEVRKYTDQVTISWDKYEDDVTYTLKLYNLDNGKEVDRGTFEGGTIGRFTWTYDDLKENTNYRWELAANDKDGIPARVQSGTFYSGHWNQQAKPENLGADVNKSTNDVILSWKAPEASPGTELSYTISIYEGVSGAHVYTIEDVKGYTDIISLTVKNEDGKFKDKTPYIWSVTAVNSLEDQSIAVEGGTVTYVTGGIEKSASVYGSFETNDITAPVLTTVNVVNWEVVEVNGAAAEGTVKGAVIPGGTIVGGTETVGAYDVTAVINGAVSGGTTTSRSVSGMTGITLVGGTLESGTIVTEEVRKYTKNVTISLDPYIDDSSVNYTLKLYNLDEGKVVASPKLKKEDSTGRLTCTVSLKENMDYRWTLAAEDSAGNLAETQSGTFYSGHWEKQAGPDPEEMFCIVQQKNDVKFSWNMIAASSGASPLYYVVRVYDLEDNCVYTNEYEEEKLRKTTLTVTNKQLESGEYLFEDATDYTWTVTAVNSLTDTETVLSGGTVKYITDGIETSAEVLGGTFTTLDITPPKPTDDRVITAIDSHTNFTNFTWCEFEDKSNNVLYTFQISTDDTGEFSWLTDSCYEQEGTSFKTDVLAYDTTYYYRLRAVDQSKNKNATEWYSGTFTTPAAPSTSSAPTAVLVDGSEVTTSYTICWDKMTNADYVQIQVLDANTKTTAYEAVVAAYEADDRYRTSVNMDLSASAGKTLSVRVRGLKNLKTSEVDEKGNYVEAGTSTVDEKGYVKASTTELPGDGYVFIDSGDWSASTSITVRDDPGTSFDNARLLGIGDVYVHTVSAGSTDYYKYVLPYSGEYTITVSNSTDAVMTVYDGSRSKIQYTSGQVQAFAAGVYYVTVYGKQQVSYSITCTSSIYAPEPGKSREDAPEVEYGRTLVGTTTESATDYFKYQINSGTYMLQALTGNVETQLYKGDALIQPDENGRYILDKGYYIVGVSSGTTSASYAVDFKTSSRTDASSTIAEAATADPLENGDILTGSVGVGDAEEFYRIVGDENHSGRWTFLLTADTDNTSDYVAKNLTLQLGTLLKNGKFKKTATAVYDKNLSGGKGGYTLDMQTLAGSDASYTDLYIRIASADNGKKKSSSYRIDVENQVYEYSNINNNNIGSADNLELASGTLSDGTLMGGTSGTQIGWVGYGDAVDYYTFKADECPGNFTFTITEPANTGFTYTASNLKVQVGINNNGKFKAVATARLDKKTGQYAVSYQFAEGTDIYVCVTSADNGRGKKNSVYQLDVRKEAFARADNTNDDPSALGVVTLPSGTPTAAWVGYGDAVDFYKIDMTNAEFAGNSTLTLNNPALDDCTYNASNLQMQIGILLKNGKFKATGTAKLNKTTGTFAIQTQLDRNTEYYVKVYSADNGRKKNSSYQLTYVLDEYSNSHYDNQTPATATDLYFGKTSEESWVGFGDAVDYYALKFDEGKVSGIFSFAITDADNVKNLKLQLGKLDSKGNFKAVTTGKVKNGVLSISDYQLKNDTQYYVLVSSADNGKGNRNSGYQLQWGGTWYNANTTDDTLAQAQSQAGQKAGELLADWVGFGDIVDYRKLILDSSDTALKLSIGNTKANLKFSLCNESGSVISSLNSRDIQKGKSLALSGLSGTYYAKIETTNEKKYMTEYTLAVL